MSTALPVPLPSASQPTSTPAAVVLTDDRAVAALIDQLLSRAGLSQAELCRRLNVSPSNFNQYRMGRRMRPSLWWITRLAQACGARIIVEFPARPL